MDSMKDIEGKELVLRITGEVQSSNLDDFEATARTVIDNINTELQTDNDFVEAEENIKSCSLIEARIHNARQSALLSTEDISNLITTTERLESKFREVRLLLGRKVKSEKENRKNEITNAAKKVIDDLVKASVIRHSFTANHQGIMDAIKNKRSLEKMQEAVNNVVELEKAILINLEELYKDNMMLIEESEKEYPGLFPDKKNLALSMTDVVEAQIESRISTFKYKQEMKEKAERANAVKLAEQKKEVAIEPVEIHHTTSTIPTPPPLPSTPSNQDDSDLHNKIIRELVSNYSLNGTQATKLVEDVFNGQFEWFIIGNQS